MKLVQFYTFIASTAVLAQGEFKASHRQASPTLSSTDSISHPPRPRLQPLQDRRHDCTRSHPERCNSGRSHQLSQGRLCSECLAEAKGAMQHLQRSLHRRASCDSRETETIRPWLALCWERASGVVCRLGTEAWVYSFDCTSLFSRNWSPPLPCRRNDI